MNHDIEKIDHYSVYRRLGNKSEYDQEVHHRFAGWSVNNGPAFVLGILRMRLILRKKNKIEGILILSSFIIFICFLFLRILA